MEKNSGRHSTNYYNTFIEIAEDCPDLTGKIPVSKGENKSIAEMQYTMLVNNPYRYTSDDVLFQVFAGRNDLAKPEYKKAHEEFFSKRQPCFRASPLIKRYGFGIHADGEGEIALYGADSREYQQFLKDPAVKKVKAMRTSKN